MSTIAAPVGDPSRAVMAAADRIDVAGRNLRNLWRTPQAMIFATVQAVIFVLLFRYAFGGAVHVPGGSYVDCLMPGIFAHAVTLAATGAPGGVSNALKSGLVTRV